jgi:hypothetical protein
LFLSRELRSKNLLKSGACDHENSMAPFERKTHFIVQETKFSESKKKYGNKW